MTELEGPANFRDLGGLTVAGGTVRTGMLYRSDSLVGLSDADRDTLRDVGIRTVLDLRSPEEVANGITELAGDGAAFHHLPIGRRLGSIVARGGRSVSMAEGYLAMLEASGGSAVAAVTALSEPGTLPAVFHCAGGKDRTGLLAAVVLGLLGAEPDVIVADYARTTERFHLVVARLMAEVQYADILERVDEVTLSSDPESMAGLLDLVDRRHGGMAGLLAPHGLEAGTVDRLRDALVSPGGT